MPGAKALNASQRVLGMIADRNHRSVALFPFHSFSFRLLQNGVCNLTDIGEFGKVVGAHLVFPCNLIFCALRGVVTL